MVSSSLYVSHMFVARALSNLFFTCPSLELVSPQVKHLPPVWDLLLPLAQTPDRRDHGTLVSLPKDTGNVR